LQAAHIFDIGSKQAFEDASEKLKGIPLSMNDAANGLLLCPNCRVMLVKKLIKINKSGEIIVSPDTNDQNAIELQNKRVPWKSKIGKLNYPTAALLDLVFNRSKALRKRSVAAEQNGMRKRTKNDKK
jgi:hypothetical protein